MVTSDGHLVHAVIDATDDGQHGVQGRLKIVIFVLDIVRGVKGRLAVLHQISKQELIFGNSLDRLEQVGTEWKLVTKARLALTKKRIVFSNLTTQFFRLRYVLAVEAVQGVQIFRLSRFKKNKIVRKINGYHKR